MYNYFKSDNIPDDNKIILDWEKIYEYKKHISDDHANKYKRTVESEIKEKGLYSKTIQTEWYCNFNMNTDSFITLEEMRLNNMFKGSIEDDLSVYDDKKSYRIGAIDFALSGDRCTFMGGISGFTEDLTWTNIRTFEVIKELGATIDPETIMDRAVSLCKKHKLDYLIVDNTASQKYIVTPLYKRIAKETGTQLIPLDTSGFAEKVKMCRYNEALIHQQLVKLPEEEFIKQNKGFDYTVKELQNLEKKKNQNGEYSYRGAGSSNDDFAITYFMLNYALKYLIMSMDDRKRFKLGNILLRLYLKKWTDREDNDNDAHSPMWMNTF